MALSDIEIARQANKKPIKAIADTLNIHEGTIHPFGHFMAKITSEASEKLAAKKSKRQAKEDPKKDIEVEKKLDESIPIDLNFLTNPDKK